jgi:hypothetical protein
MYLSSFLVASIFQPPEPLHVPMIDVDEVIRTESDMKRCDRVEVIDEHERRAPVLSMQVFMWRSI